MADTQKAVLHVLLQSLLDRGLLPQAAHDKAKNIVNSALDFPEFFEYCVCCREEGETNGCTQD